MAAQGLGIDVTKARWNIKTMFHYGNHSDAYYDAVRKRLHPVWQAYRASGFNWSAEEMERQLMEVALGIRRDIFWLRLKLY